MTELDDAIHDLVRRMVADLGEDHSDDAEEAFALAFGAIRERFYALGLGSNDVLLELERRDLAVLRRQREVENGNYEAVATHYYVERLTSRALTLGRAS